MKISIASDHAGFKLKEAVKERLKALGHDVLDRGTYDETSVDYPDYGALAARDVSDGVAERGVLICGSGIGMSMVGNRIKDVRAALCTSTIMAEMSRKHNDANVLTMGARYTDPDLAMQILDVWLNTEFEGGRHQRRIDKIMRLGEK